MRHFVNTNHQDLTEFSTMTCLTNLQFTTCDIVRLFKYFWGRWSCVMLRMLPYLIYTCATKNNHQRVTPLPSRQLPPLRQLPRSLSLPIEMSLRRLCTTPAAGSAANNNEMPMSPKEVARASAGAMLQHGLGRTLLFSGTRYRGA